MQVPRLMLRPLVYVAVLLVSFPASHRGVASRYANVVMVFATVPGERMKMDVTSMTLQHIQIGEIFGTLFILFFLHQKQELYHLTVAFFIYRAYTHTPSPLKTPSMASVTHSAVTPTVRIFFIKQLF